MPHILTSPAFAKGETIPVKYGCDGANVSPLIQWSSGVRNRARCLALIMEDPDAPGGAFRHWAAFNIPLDFDHLPEGVRIRIEWGLREGRNDFGHSRHDGSQPPRGHGAHPYQFRLAALDAPSPNIPRSEAPAVQTSRIRHASYSPQAGVER